MSAIDDADPIDHAHLTEMSGGDKEFEAELMQEFLNSTPHLLENLRRAIQQGARKDAELSAHTLKGSCRSLGANAMAEPCYEIESMARSGDLTGATEKEREATKRFEILRQYIVGHWNVNAA